MTKTNITIRVDVDLKKSAEQACEFLGVSMTAVIHTALHQAIAQAAHFSNIQAHFYEQLKLNEKFSHYLLRSEFEKPLPPIGFNPKDYESSGVNILQVQIYLREIAELLRAQSASKEGKFDE